MMDQEQMHQTVRTDYSDGGRYRENQSRSSSYGYYTDSRVGEERGYVLGVEDERKKFRVKMAEIIRNLKARGYPLLHIAEDTGYSVEEISMIKPL